MVGSHEENKNANKILHRVSDNSIEIPPEYTIISKFSVFVFITYP
jgi:hypothetical protein